MGEFKTWHWWMTDPQSGQRVMSPTAMTEADALKLDSSAQRVYATLEIELPAELRPESKAKIRIREGGKRAMQAMVAVVDEGLLDLTRFKTPEPWPSFYG